MGLNIFDELVSEWAYRSRTGAPSVKNQEDLFLLEDILLEMGIEPNMVIENIRLLNEEPEDEEPKDSDDENWKKGYTHKNWGFYVKDSDVGKDDAQIYKADSDKGKMLPVSQDEYEKVKKERGDGKDSQAKDAKGQGETTDDTQAPPAGKLTAADFDNTDRALKNNDDNEIGNDRSTNISNLSDSEKQKLRKDDHERTDEALMMTQTKAEEQAAMKGEKGVGLGTPESRAGEAMVHKALRLMKEGKSDSEIKDYFEKVVNSPDHILNSPSGKKWVPSAMASAKKVADVFGMENISEIAWDTPEGNKLMDTEGHGTSADMFVKLNDGTRVGVSLKKDGQVFIRNGGYQKTLDGMVSDMKDSVDEETLQRFAEMTDIAHYNSELKQSAAQGAGFISQDPSLLGEIEKLKNNPSYAKKVMGGDAKYLDSWGEAPFTDFLNEIQSGTAKVKDLKAYAKIVGSPSVKEINPELYSNMRAADANATARILNGMKESPKLDRAMRKEALKGIHVQDVLGISENPKLDKFVTVYGIGDDGSELSEETLLTMFGERSRKLLQEYRNAGSVEEKEKYKKLLNEELENRINIDYEDGAKDGVVKIMHEGPPTQEFPLFKLATRSRGIGSALTMEMAQTSYLANALEYGLDVDKWPKRQRKSFYIGEINKIKAQIGTSPSAEVTAELNNELEKLREKI